MNAQDHSKGRAKRWFTVGAIAIVVSSCGQVRSPQSVAPPSAADPIPSGSVAVTSPASPVSPTPAAPPLTLASEPDVCNQPQTQAEMSSCASRLAKQEDDELNKTYQALRSQLSGAREEQLIDAQLAWIAFRDADCAYVASQFEGGSMQPQVVNDCIARLTSQRTAQLKDYLSTEKQGF